MCVAIHMLNKEMVVRNFIHMSKYHMVSVLRHVAGMCSISDNLQVSCKKLLFSG